MANQRLAAPIPEPPPISPERSSFEGQIRSILEAMKNLEEIETKRHEYAMREIREAAAAEIDKARNTLKAAGV